MSHANDIKEKLIQIFNEIKNKNLKPSEFENEEMDFKNNIKLNKELLEDVVCFANAKGGIIVVGIDDKIEGINSVSGIELINHNLDDLKSYVWNNTNPQIEIECKVSKYENKDILIIIIPKANKPTMTSSGVFKKRIGRNCLPYNPYISDYENEKLMEKNPFNDGWEIKIEPIPLKEPQDINFIDSLLENFIIRFAVSLYGYNKWYLHPFLLLEQDDYIKDISKDKIEIYLTAKETKRRMYLNAYREEKLVVYNDFRIFHYFTFIEDNLKLFDYNFLDKNLCILIFYCIEEFFKKLSAKLKCKLKFEIKIAGLRERKLNVRSKNALLSFQNGKPEISAYEKKTCQENVWKIEFFNYENLLYLSAKSLFGIYNLNIKNEEIDSILKEVILGQGICINL